MFAALRSQEPDLAGEAWTRPLGPAPQRARERRGLVDLDVTPGARPGPDRERMHLPTHERREQRAAGDESGDDRPPRLRRVRRTVWRTPYMAGPSVISSPLECRRGSANIEQPFVVHAFASLGSLSSMAL